MKILRNVLAVILGVIIGGIVNMFLITHSGDVIPLPEGINPEDPESLKAGMHLFEPQNYIMPFLAHALGTLVGALVAILVAASAKKVFAYVIGFTFLLGGIMMVIQLPSPLWYASVDLLFAYIPMAWIATKLVKK